MLGDSQIGKTSLMVKYVEGHFDEDYIQTLGPCFQHWARMLSLNRRSYPSPDIPSLSDIPSGARSIVSGHPRFPRHHRHSVEYIFSTPSSLTTPYYRQHARTRPMR